MSKKVTIKKPAAKTSKPAVLKPPKKTELKPKPKQTPPSKRGKPVKGYRSKIDWDKARTMYMSDNTCTYQKVADTFGVTRSTVGKRADDEGWREARAKLTEETNNQLQAMLVDEKSQVNDRHLEHWRNIQRIASEHLKAYDPLECKDQSDKPRTFSMDSKGFKQVAQTFKIAIDGERVILGLPIIIQHNKNEDLEAPEKITPEEIERLEADARNRARSRQNS